MKFEEALNNLLSIEGGYSYDKDDKGGETYKGISKGYHPNWNGWSIIDDYKKVTDKWQVLLQGNVELQDDVKKFYKTEYWDKFRGDELPFIVAEELLEQSVNLGNWNTAGKQLQKALNLLNRNGKLFVDLDVDGYVGKKTIDAVHKVKERRLLKVLNGLQFMRYYNLDITHPANEKFVGWFDRV